MLSCPDGGVAITPIEVQISALDNQKAQVEQTLVSVLFEHDGFLLATFDFIYFVPCEISFRLTVSICYLAETRKSNA